MPPAPHDALFKAIFSEPRQAAAVLQHALPAEVVRHVDFATLRVAKGSFVDDELRAHHTDLLFTVDYAGAPAWLYLLFEHMSKPEATMPLRLLDYMVDAWNESLTRTPRPRWLPVIIPVVLHHSDTGWRGPTSFEGLFDPATPIALRRFVPHFCFALDDLTTVDDEVLVGRAMSAVACLALSALKHARSAAALLPLVPSWTRLARAVLREPDGARALQLVFQYLHQVRGPGELPVLREIATRAADEKTMQTIAEMFIEQGWEKGLQEGRKVGLQEGRKVGRQEGREDGLLIGERNVLRRMLRRRFGELPADVLARLEAADQASLEAWAEELLSAGTLADVFAAR